jgi:hypothetical protein
MTFASQARVVAEPGPSAKRARDSDVMAAVPTVTVSALGGLAGYDSES